VRNALLDATVIVKGLLKSYQRLPAEIYKRELETLISANTFLIEWRKKLLRFTF
jgi:hypothetical protein